MNGALRGDEKTEVRTFLARGTSGTVATGTES
jgi:hypothetical protein